MLAPNVTASLFGEDLKPGGVESAPKPNPPAAANRPPVAGVAPAAAAAVPNTLAEGGDVTASEPFVKRGLTPCFVESGGMDGLQGHESSGLENVIFSGLPAAFTFWSTIQ
jgi:hypothetical protein